MKVAQILHQPLLNLFHLFSLKLTKNDHPFLINEQILSPKAKPRGQRKWNTRIKWRKKTEIKNLEVEQKQRQTVDQSPQEGRWKRRDKTKQANV